MNLNDVARGGTMCLGYAGLKVGTTESGVATAAAISYSINGELYTKAITATAAITAAKAQAEETTCLYLVCLNAAGTLSTVKGKEVATKDLTAKADVLRWPVPKEATCPIGYVKVAVTGTGVTFTAGSTLLSASGVTATYGNLMCIPTAPLTA